MHAIEYVSTMTRSAKDRCPVCTSSPQVTRKLHNKYSNRLVKIKIRGIQVKKYNFDYRTSYFGTYNYFKGYKQQQKVSYQYFSEKKIVHNTYKNFVKLTIFCRRIHSKIQIFNSPLTVTLLTIHLLVYCTVLQIKLML